jgi:hypothetical protein
MEWNGIEWNGMEWNVERAVSEIYFFQDGDQITK